MADVVINTVFKLKRGTAEAWLRHNPVLQTGEPGFEIDTNKLKIGNGLDAWENLKYLYDNEYSLSPDGKSVVIDNSGKLTLFGFKEALINTIPMKDENGNLIWKNLKTGDENTAGLTKLYNSVGTNEDGTMTQKTITDELNEKIEIELNHDEELLIFSY